LVAAPQIGDDRSFAELVRIYQDIAVAYTTALLGDYRLAEDAVGSIQHADDSNATWTRSRNISTRHDHPATPRSPNASQE
jgi:hypothetical protein